MTTSETGPPAGGGWGGGAALSGGKGGRSAGGPLGPKRLRLEQGGRVSEISDLSDPMITAWVIFSPPPGEISGEIGRVRLSPRLGAATLGWLARFSLVDGVVLVPLALPHDEDGNVMALPGDEVSVVADCRWGAPGRA